MQSAPAEVIALAQERALARADKDFARSDELRDSIAALGWVIKDSTDGYVLTERPPFDVYPNLGALPAASAIAPVTIGLIIDGWPDDLRACLDALLAHAPGDAVIIGLDLGNVDSSGAVLHEYAKAHPGRIVEVHVDQLLPQAGWSASAVALLTMSTAPAHVVMDLSSVLDGDAITPLVKALGDGVVAAGWKGADIDRADAWRSVRDAGPGEVDVLLGYLMVVDRAFALEHPPHPKAKFYRNADLEWSLNMRAAGGRLVVPTTDLPVHQDRHRGYHDSDPEYRDRESKKTYDRILQAFRGREEILHGS